MNLNKQILKVTDTERPMIQPGTYPARMISIATTRWRQNDSCVELTFLLLDGPYEGKSIKSRHFGFPNQSCSVARMIGRLSSGLVPIEAPDVESLFMQCEYDLTIAINPFTYRVEVLNFYMTNF